ncbi:MAG: Gfo/Idh/MocA family oxidoreductase [Planctomycetota bacterium]
MKTAAVIGCGKAKDGAKEGWAIGHSHAHGLREAFPGVKLYGVDPDPVNLAAFGERFDLSIDQLFNSTEALYAAFKPDCVSIATWPGLHHPQVIEAADHGVNAVLCEKPMALDGSEIDDMIAACEKAGTRLAIAHQRRHDPWFTKARQLLAEGVLGEKLVLTAHVGENWDMLSWTTHWFDMANYLLDDRPMSVLAGVDHTGQRRYGHAVEDSSVVQIDYERGAKAVFLTLDEAGPFGYGIHVVGERGLMQISEGRDEVHVMTSDGFTAHPVETDAELSGYSGLYRELWRAVEDPSSEVRCGVEQTALATRTAFAAYESARTMRRVALPPRDLGFAPLEVAQHPSRRNKLFKKAVLLADPHHADENGEGGREGLIDALHAEVCDQVHAVSVDQREPVATDFDGAELLVIYHTVQTSSPDTRKLVGDWIEAGRPTVIAHCGIGAYADWPWFREQIGRYWVWGGEELPPSRHPHVPCELSVVEGSGFDPGFDTAWLPRDEVYMSLGVAAPVRELVTAETSQGKAYITWQAEGVDNVAVWAPGHRREIWGLPAMRSGLRATAQLVSNADSPAGVAG